MKYPKMTWGLMEAVVNKMGGEASLRRFLKGDLALTGVPNPQCYWEEKDGIFYITLPLELSRYGQNGNGMSVRDTQPKGWGVSWWQVQNQAFDWSVV